jgi:heme/copper-type cytochrome/quinol oxidase subunit 2
MHTLLTIVAAILLLFIFFGPRAMSTLISLLLVWGLGLWASVIQAMAQPDKWGWSVLAGVLAIAMIAVVAWSVWVLWFYKPKGREQNPATAAVKAEDSKPSA